MGGELPVGAVRSASADRLAPCATRGHYALVVRAGNRGTSDSVQQHVRRVALSLISISVVSSCGSSTAGTETSSPAAATSAADTTMASTFVVPTDQATTGGSNSVVSTDLVPGADVVVNDPLVPGAWTGARTSRDGLSLALFFVGAAEYEQGQPCTMRYVPVVDETAAEVAVVMHGERPPEADDRTVCPAIGFERSVAVELAQPFGNRTLVALGQARGVLDGSTLAEPQWLPDGWDLGPESPGLLDPDGTTWRRSWRPTGDTSCALGTSGLALLEGAPDAVNRSSPPADQTVTGSHDINGATATETVQTNRNITRLTWTVGDRSYVLSSAPACDGDEPPSLDIMLAFHAAYRPEPSTGRARSADLHSEPHSTQLDVDASEP